MSDTNYLINKELDHLFGYANFTQPELYLAFSVTDPAVILTEPADPTYARVAAPAANWQRSGQTVSNVNQLSFPQTSEGGETYTHVLIMDAATGGNILSVKALGTPITPTIGQVVRFRPGELTYSRG